MTTNGHKGSFWGDGIVLILDCGDDCTTCEITEKPLNHTPKISGFYSI